MADHFIRLNDVSGEVSVLLSVASGARGDYRFKLWNDRGRDPEPRGDGRFDGRTEYPPLALGAAAKLRGRTLTWTLRFAATAGSDDAEYRASVRVVKDGDSTLHAIEYSGPLDDLKEVADLVHFEPA